MQLDSTPYAWLPGVGAPVREPSWAAGVHNWAFGPARGGSPVLDGSAHGAQGFLDGGRVKAAGWGLAERHALDQFAPCQCQPSAFAPTTSPLPEANLVAKGVSATAAAMARAPAGRCSDGRCESAKCDGAFPTTRTAPRQPTPPRRRAAPAPLSSVLPVFDVLPAVGAPARFVPWCGGSGHSGRVCAPSRQGGELHPLAAQKPAGLSSPQPPSRCLSSSSPDSAAGPRGHWSDAVSRHWQEASTSVGQCAVSGTEPWKAGSPGVVGSRFSDCGAPSCVCHRAWDGVPPSPGPSATPRESAFCGSVCVAQRWAGSGIGGAGGRRLELSNQPLAAAPTDRHETPSLTPVAPSCGPVTRRPCQASPRQKVRVLRHATRSVVAELAALAAAGAEGTSERGGGGGCRRITASVHRSRDASSGSTRRSSSASTESGSCSDDNIVVQDTCSNGSSTGAGSPSEGDCDNSGGTDSGRVSGADWGNSDGTDALCSAGSCSPSASEHHSNGTHSAEEPVALEGTAVLAAGAVAENAGGAHPFVTSSPTSCASSSPRCEVLEFPFSPTPAVSFAAVLRRDCV